MHERMHFIALTIKMQATFLALRRRHKYDINANIQIHEEQIATTHPISIPFSPPSPLYFSTNSQS
jgi:hypothetical protein